MTILGGKKYMKDIQRFKKFFNEMNIGYSFDNFYKEDSDEVLIYNMCIDKRVIDVKGYGQSLSIVFDENGKLMFFEPWGE